MLRVRPRGAMAFARQGRYRIDGSGDLSEGGGRLMDSKHLDELDGIASEVLAGDASRVGLLSTTDCLYVVLAANRLDLAPQWTFAQAIDHLGAEKVSALVERWRRRQAPAYTASDSHLGTDLQALLATVVADPATTYRLRSRIEEDTTRDPIDALNDAELLYKLCALRVEQALRSSQH